MEKEEDPFSFERKLKKHSIAEIEQVISDAISKLVGCEYEADISKIDFKPGNMSYMNDSYDIKLSIERVRHEDKDLPF